MERKSLPSLSFALALPLFLPFFFSQQRQLKCDRSSFNSRRFTSYGWTHGILITGGRHLGFLTTLLLFHCTSYVPDTKDTPDLKLQGLMFPRLNTSNGFSGASAMQGSRQKIHLQPYFFGIIHSWKHRMSQHVTLMNVRFLPGKFGVFSVS